uniref:Ash family protein n=1 Tax=Panagrellus redivivus TaxID=6233 RepID=A0A7E4UN56_PANRE
MEVSDRKCITVPCMFQRGSIHAFVVTFSRSHFSVSARFVFGSARGRRHIFCIAERRERETGLFQCLAR